jgi:biotin transport system substrate-specific component
MEMIFSRNHVKIGTEVLIASVLLGLSALVRIPLGPVPFTLQTFALFVIALRMTPSLALSSVLLYLAYHTALYPMWIVGPTAGYLFAFPLVAFFSSFLAQKYSPLFSVVLGQIILYLCGVSWLSLFVGPSSAIWGGMVLFLISDCCKFCAAILFVKK